MSSIRGGRGRIRGPRKGFLGDAFSFEEIWAVLSQSLREIHMKNASSLSFEELYRNAYKLVLKKHGHELYQRVKALINEHLQQVGVDDIRPLLPSGGYQSGGTLGTAATERRDGGSRFLAAVKKAWEDHQLCLGMMCDVLMYLDRVYCVDNKEPSIYIAGMGLFRDCILRNPSWQIGRHLNSVILDLIQMEREGDSINRATVRSCIYMLEGLYENNSELEADRLYLTSFEGDFLKASTDFYKAEGDKLLRECDAGTYLRKTNRRLDEEYARTQNTISPLTEPKIRAVVEKCLISDNIVEVMDMEGSGIKHMIDNNKYDDLALLYTLIARVDQDKAILKEKASARLIELGEEVTKSILSSAAPSNAAPVPTNNAGPSDETAKAATSAKEEKEAVSATTLAIRWVDDILALKDKFDRIWEQSFDKDKGLNAALSRAFSKIINNFQESPEYMSLFIDENLKKGVKGKTEEEIDHILDKAITLFRYITNKDKFEDYYKKHLARRLLMGRSVSHDVEKQMIGKLKMEAGVSFTGHMEGMFKDMSVSEDLTTEFRKHREQLEEGNEPTSRVELGVHMLTPTFWPTKAMGIDPEVAKGCTYPREVEQIREQFTKYYLNLHSGRKLEWQANLGTADIKATFKGRKHEINVSTYAMVILTCFNDLPEGQSLSFEEIHTITSIPRSELVRNLQSIAVANKTRLLRKEPMSKEIQPSDRFFFNDKFTSKYTRLKISAVANRAETEKERKETDAKVNEQRSHMIEAAIVRTMKQRKEAAHSDLMQEVIHQLVNRFSPDPTMIKKRIESLIEREYLERLDTDRAAYRYVA